MNAAADHRDAYEAFYRAHQPRVLRLCRLLLADPHEADDVTQEIFLKLLRNRRMDESVTVSGAWLTTVTVNACRDRRRSGWWKWWRERHQEFHEADVPDRALTPEDDAVNAETRRHVWRAFQELSARQREIFTLRQVEGWSTADVAETLGLSTGSVKRHLYRAVHHLRGALRGEL